MQKSVFWFVFLVFCSTSFAKRAYRRPSSSSYLNLPSVTMDASSLFPSAPGLSALGSETLDEPEAKASGLEIPGGLSLDSIESVGDFSFIEEGEEDLSQLGELIGSGTGKTSIEKAPSSDFQQLLQGSTSFLNSEDPLRIENSILDDVGDGLLKVNEDSFSSLDDF